MQVPKKPKNPKRTLIITSIATLIIVPLFFWFSPIPFYFAPLLCAIMIGYLFFAYFKEKKQDKKANELLPSLLDDSYFSSVEWREKYLVYAQDNPFERPSDSGMRADLSKRYRTGSSLMLLILGLAFFICGVGTALSRYSLAAVLSAFFVGIFLAYLGGRSFFAFPVRQLCKRTDIDIAAVEESYGRGHILSHKGGGINIGHEYTVIWRDHAVDVLETARITSFFRKIVRVKKYQNDIYAGDEIRHKLCIVTDREYDVELNEFQVEMAFIKLEKLADISRTDYSEDTENEVVT